MKQKRPTNIGKILKLAYAMAWICVFALIAVSAVSPVSSTVQSDIPQLDTNKLAKILGGLSQRKAATLSEPFDFGTMKYGKPEPFK
jgi:hypothetical protein